MPIKVAHGKQPGPCLLIIAAMHGNEVNGTEIINKLMASKSLNRLKGTIIAIPVLNIFGLINRSRYLPGGINLNRSFPGSLRPAHRQAFPQCRSVQRVQEDCTESISNVGRERAEPSLFQMLDIRLADRPVLARAIFALQ